MVNHHINPNSTAPAPKSNRIPYNSEHFTQGPFWEFMRDTWEGEHKIVEKAESSNYLSRKSKMDDRNFNVYSNCGRFPELTSRLLRMGVERALLNQPEGYDKLSLFVDNPRKFLTWILTQVGLVSSAGIALSFDSDTPKFVQYNTENVVNWSETSIAFEDCIVSYDEFGFIDDTMTTQKVYHLNEFNEVMITEIPLDDSAIPNSEVVSFRGRTLREIPACRICTDNKPIFYSLARCCLHYYRMTANRSFTLHQIVPQAVLKLPPTETQENWELANVFSEEGFDVGLGSIMTIPHGSEFGYQSPNIRSIAETRHEISLIKDEMVILGAMPYFQKAGQVNTLNDSAIRIHTDDQIMTFSDVVGQCEYSINKLLRIACNLTNEVYEPFRFQYVDYDDHNELKDIIESYVSVYDPRNEIPEDIQEQLLDVIEERTSSGTSETGIGSKQGE